MPYFRPSDLPPRWVGVATRVHAYALRDAAPGCAGLRRAAPAAPVDRVYFIQLAENGPPFGFKIRIPVSLIEPLGSKKESKEQFS